MNDLIKLDNNTNDFARFLLKDLITLKGIGAETLKKFKKLNLHTIKDLLTYFPYSHTDLSNIYTIKEIKLKNNQNKYLIKAKIKNFKNIKLKNKKTIQLAIAEDNTDQINLIWFNQEYLKNSIKINENYFLYGKIYFKNRRTYLLTEKFYLDTQGENIHIGRIVSEYYTTAGLKKEKIRLTIKQIIENIKNFNLSDIEKLLYELIKEYHFPKKLTNLENIRRELGKYELINLQIKVLKNKLNSVNKIEQINIININNTLNEFKKLLPFELSKDQESCILEINKKIEKNEKINSIVQGDVGSGKTVIAMYLAFITSIKGNYTTIIICPTTILAEQIYKNFLQIFGKENICLITSANKSKYKNIKNFKIVIGTSAILFLNEKEIGLLNIKTLIVDEQQKFGVNQREKILKIYQNKIPNYLNLTATPIPRSIAQIFFGDIEVMNIKTKPEGRKIVKTYMVDKHKKLDLINWVNKKIKKNSQVFWVCPAVEENFYKTGNENIKISSVKEIYKELTNKLPNVQIDMIHGKMVEKEKTKKIIEFTEGKTKILVSSSVIEIGIDIKEADIIIIENPERFGLAQLHQMRGRVGRNNKEDNFCILITDKNSEKIDIERLKFFTKNNDGIKIAEYDLLKRGPGEVYGIKQSGIPNFKIAKIQDFLEESKKIKEKALYLLNKGVNEIPFF